MKIPLHLIVAMTLALCALETKAQLPQGIAPDWTFTDLNGTSWNLYSELDSGKTVFIDVSTTWCDGCWYYHNQHSLDSLYNQYGPSGTNEVRVFFIEGDPTTNTACMYGWGTCSGFSMGDWVTGTSYPMINPDSTSTVVFDTNYNMNTLGFPTVFMICPNRFMTSLVGPITGQGFTAQLYAEKTTCPAPATQINDPELLSYTGTTVTCANATIAVMLQNNGFSPLTACTITAMNGSTQIAQVNWTGNLATYATQNVTVGTTTLATTTNLTVSITSADDNIANNTVTQTIIYKQNESLPITEGFESSFNFPIGWDVERHIDVDNILLDTTTWLVSNSVGGFGNSIHSAKLDLFNNNTPGDCFDLNTTRYNFHLATTPLKMTFDVASQNTWDTLKVNVSTDCGATWINKYAKSDTTLMTAPADTTYNLFIPNATQWRTDTVDLSSFVGQSDVVIQFKIMNDYGGNDLYLDNINIITTNAGIAENTSGTNNINVFPNPFNNNAILNFEMKETQPVTLNIYDVLSRKIYSENEGLLNSGSHSVKLNGNNLKAGVYFITLETEKGILTQKIMVSK